MSEHAHLSLVVTAVPFPQPRYPTLVLANLYKRCHLFVGRPDLSRGFDLLLPKRKRRLSERTDANAMHGPTHYCWLQRPSARRTAGRCARRAGRAMR